MMLDFYFPALPLRLDPTCDGLNSGAFTLIHQKNIVRIETVNGLNPLGKSSLAPEQLAVFLHDTTMEFKISAINVQSAVVNINRLRAMLYIRGLSPFILPFVSSHSVNDYLRLNKQRDEYIRSLVRQEDGAPDPPEAEQIRFWPLDYTIRISSGEKQWLTKDVFKQAVQDVTKWSQIIEQSSQLRTVEKVLLMAPFIGATDRGQYILHIWSGIETLFPDVQTEVSFRLALYLAQLYCGATDKWQYYKNIKKAYGTRSNITHGTNTGKNVLTDIDGELAWNLLGDACISILQRGKLPGGEELVQEMLRTESSQTDEPSEVL